MTEPDRSRRGSPGLPPLALAALYLFATLLPIALALRSVGRGADVWVRLGIAAGIAAFAMLLMQMVSSGRFERLSGRLGIDVTMGFHKWAAPVALALALAHPILLVGPPGGDRPNRFARHLDRILHGPDLTEARLALVLLAVLVLSALLRDRLRLRYEIWRAGHALGAIALIALTLAHVLTDGRGADDWGVVYWIGFAALVTAPAAWVYLRRIAFDHAGDWSVAQVRPVADRLWEVALSRPSGAPAPFRAGQFAWLAFGRHRLPLFDHPFSFASPPSEGTRPRFLIREAGDFTATIGTLPVGTRVGMDAPHGSFVLEDDTSPVLLVAGGVGIAPILSILGDLADRGDRRPVRLIYAARGPEALVDPALWRPALERLDARAIVLTDTPPGAPDIRQGPMTEAHMREALDGLDPAGIRALICGPGPMMTAAADCLHGCGTPYDRIDYERFEYDARSLSGKDRRMLGWFLALWGATIGAIIAFAFV